MKRSKFFIFSNQTNLHWYLYESDSWRGKEKSCSELSHFASISIWRCTIFSLLVKFSFWSDTMFLMNFYRALFKIYPFLIIPSTGANQDFMRCLVISSFQSFISWGDCLIVIILIFFTAYFQKYLNKFDNWYVIRYIIIKTNVILNIIW